MRASESTPQPRRLYPSQPGWLTVEQMHNNRKRYILEMGAQEIQRMTTRERQEQQREAYRSLFDIAEGVHRWYFRTPVRQTARTCLPIWPSPVSVTRFSHYCDLGSRVINQARRRVLDGKQVANAEKIYSIFEPHTDLIKRGKVGTPLEFGHKVFLAESAQGLITQYEVLKGNPSDEIHVAPSLKRHKEAFRSAPRLYGADRGFFSEQNVESCERSGVNVVSIPQRKKAPEREKAPRLAGAGGPLRGQSPRDGGTEGSNRATRVHQRVYRTGQGFGIGARGYRPGWAART
jgi:hypothetical protein